MAAHGSGRHPGFEGRLPVIAHARTSAERPHIVGPAAVAMSSVVSDSAERRETMRQRDSPRQPQEDLE